MRINILKAAAAALVVFLPGTASAQRFYRDDPITKEPPPFSIEGAGYRSMNSLYEFFTNVFGIPGERQPSNGVIPAQGVNTLGEVPDGPWFVNRHSRKRLSLDELARGPGNDDPPARGEAWRVLTVKRYDILPGLLIQDSDLNLYLLRFDPPGQMEMPTGAGMIGSRLYHALGYWVPESYLVGFERSQLVAAAEGEDINAVGEAQKLKEEDIDLFLKAVPRNPAGGYRALAIKAPRGAQLLGPYQFFGTRSDDPNDIVAREHRRDLRGLHIISAWLGNNWLEAAQTQDALVQEGGAYFIRHYLADFSTLLGSGFQQEKNAREGYEEMFDLGQTLRNFIGLGFYSPGWQRAHYPGIPSVGLFEYSRFDPAKWRPNYAVAALANHLPDDDYWAAKQIMAISDEELRAIVETARYSDKQAEAWIIRCLIERRNKIGRYCFGLVLPLDNFRLEGTQLQYDDLAVRFGFRERRDYSIEWFDLNNITGELRSILSQGAWEVPDRAMSAAAESYYAAKISAGEPEMTVTVYLRKEKDGFAVVGTERFWPGKRLAGDNVTPELTVNRYPELSARQQELFNTFLAAYNSKTGFNITPEEGYKTLAISERTTFEAVTHALAMSQLTDETGKPLGAALDLVTGIVRIAGQYYGRQGDEQFRLYVTLRPDTRDILERSREFHFGHENTVYHVGYPHSYRQTGKYPNMQFSVSDDGLSADIDVDYRSSKLPAAMWNGHLTSANSDVRAGDNYKRHNNRWSGLVVWWQGLFGDLPETKKDESDLLARTPPEPATPLPPDRPAGAVIAEVQDAVQEFLTDWLVRRNYDEALTFVSDQGLACVQLEEDTQRQSLTPQQVRRQLRLNMQALSEQMGKFENLTQAIDAVCPWRRAFRVIEQPFSGDFCLVHAPDAFAKVFACQDRSDEALTRALDDPNPQYGNTYGALFRFKVQNDRGGVIGLMWTREQGAWRLVSWKVYEQ